MDGCPTTISGLILRSMRAQHACVSKDGHKYVIYGEREGNSNSPYYVQVNRSNTAALTILLQNR
jgi:hypothetical protein